MRDRKHNYRPTALENGDIFIRSYLVLDTIHPDGTGLGARRGRNGTLERKREAEHEQDRPGGGGVRVAARPVGSRLRFKV
jgi:hypothetical protein